MLEYRIAWNRKICLKFSQAGEYLFKVKYINSRFMSGMLISNGYIMGTKSAMETPKYVKYVYS